MEERADIRASVIAKTGAVPALSGPAGDGARVAGQLDAALLKTGFVCSKDLLAHLASFHPSVTSEASREILEAVKELVGDHVEHNVYFKDFPDNVPDTIDFWNQCIIDALGDPSSAPGVAAQVTNGRVNLLDLPKYGRYQHSYEEMLAGREEFVAGAKDRLTVLGLGKELSHASHELYLNLAESPVPLSAEDLVLLGVLAEIHIDDDQPERVDIRESRAVINRVLIDHDREPVVDTPTDILRLAAALSDGDVSLSRPTRFRSFPRRERRALLGALDRIITKSPAKLADVNRHREQFKRLGERLHPHQYPQWGSAQDAFAVARGDRRAQTLAGKIELAFEEGDPDRALELLKVAPGILVRSVDRLLRAGANVDELARAIDESAGSVSTRVLLSLREHLMNRTEPDRCRIFVNQMGRAWVTPDERPALSSDQIDAVSAALDHAIGSRLEKTGHLVLGAGARELALPLSEKSRPEGIGILPRGSTEPISQQARFFIHWHQRAKRTDYDLSVLMLNDDFEAAGQVSWTNLSAEGAVHSGDITEAPSGASEFIDLDLSKVSARYVVPQVNVYSGEGFDEVKEAFFGFMAIDPEQKGRPFEPRSVRSKSDLVGGGRVSLPVIFKRGDDGSWQAQWMHLVLNGHPNFNRVEGNWRSASLPVEAIVNRRYLTVAYLEQLYAAKKTRVSDYDAGKRLRAPVTYIGPEAPESLPEGSSVFTPQNLKEVLP